VLGQNKNQTIIMSYAVKVCVLGFLVFWGAVFLSWPMGRDQGIYAWVGSVIVDGGVPYKDAWDIKGPMTYLCYALVQIILGQNQWGIRLFDFFMLLGGLFSVYQLTKRMSDKLGGCCAAVIFFGMYSSTRYWHTAQPDGWTAMLLLTVLFIVLQPDFGASLFGGGVAGLLLGIAFLFKPIFLVFLPLLALFLLMRNKWKWPGVVSAIITIAVSFSLPVIIMLIWFGYHGALDALVEILFRFNPIVHAPSRGLSLTDHIRLINRFILRYYMFLPFFAVGLVKVYNRHRANGFLLGAFLLSAVLCVIIQAKYFAYHWHPASGIIAIFCGIGLTTFYRWSHAFLSNGDNRYADSLGWKLKRAVMSRLTQIFMVIVLLSFLKPRLLKSTLRWGKSVIGLTPWKAYYGGFATKRYGEGDFSYLAEVEVAKYISNHTSRKDTVLVWGFEALINYLAQRHSPTRFGYNNPLTRGEVNPLETVYRREFMEKLMKSPPVYIIVVDYDQGNMMPKSSKEFLTEFDKLKEYLESNYQLEKVIEHFDLWRFKA
jgi:hypothetical protein